MSGNGGSGKKSESGKESGGTTRGRRNERRNGRGKESGNGRETKTATAGPEKESETETGIETEAVTRAPNAADPGEGKNLMLQISVKPIRAGRETDKHKIYSPQFAQF